MVFSFCPSSPPGRFENFPHLSLVDEPFSLTAGNANKWIRIEEKNYLQVHLMSERTYINSFQQTFSKNTYKCCGINRNKIAKIVERLFSNSGKPFLFNENRITWQHLLNDSHLYFSFATSSLFFFYSSFPFKSGRCFVSLSLQNICLHPYPKLFRQERRNSFIFTPFTPL